MFRIYAIFNFIMGMVFGSLGSVLLSRLEDKCDRKTIKSILVGRSKCPKCKQTLKATELIPLASYLIQKGKCKHCGIKISKEYPILEIVSGIVFLVTYRALYNTQSNIILGITDISNLIFWMGTNRLLMLLIIHDFKTFELHLPIWGILMLWIRGRQILGNTGNYKEAFIGTITLVLIFGAIFLFGKRYVRKRFKSEAGGFGEGDIYVAATLGALFPFIGNIHNIKIDWMTSIKIGILLLIIASIIGLLYAGIRELMREKKLKETKTIDLFNEWIHTNKAIPFIPSLIFAFRILLYKADVVLNLAF